MFRLTKKTVLLQCAFILAILIMFTGTAPEIRQVFPAFALTATLNYEATPGNTCDSTTLTVDPVTSPTTLGGQAINARVSIGSSGKFTVTARTPQGSLLSDTTVNVSGNAATINIPLQANTEHRLTVTARVIVSCRNSSATPVGSTMLTRTTTVASNGSPLTIIQQGGFTLVPTNTLNPAADLAIMAINEGITGPSCNNQWITVVRLKNLGAAASFPYWVNLNGVQSPLQPELAGGAEADIYFNGIVVSNNAFVQWNQMFSDNNPNNNSLSATLQVPPPHPTCTPGTPTSTGTITPTFTRTPTQPPSITPTRLICGTPAPLAPPQVEPVISPTGELTQVIRVAGTSTNYDNVRVQVSTGGTLTDYVDSAAPFDITINLQPNMTHHLTVIGTKTFGPNACTQGYTLTSSSINDRLGNPLTIVQSSSSVVTNTPTMTRTRTRIPTRTRTPTRGPSPTRTFTPTATRTMSRTPASITVSGRVTLNSASGPGLADVTILHAFAAMPPQAITTTDANGNYSFTKIVMNQEANTVVAQKAGYSFTPAACTFSNTTFGGNFTCNFVASAGGSATPPTATFTPSATRTCAVQTPAPAPRVMPVTSPTSELTQVIRLADGQVGYSWVRVMVSTTSGSTSFTDDTAPFEVMITLFPDATNIINVQGGIAAIPGSPCSGGVTAFANRDINGNPLTIIHSSGTPVITNTPITPTTPPSGALKVQYRAADTNASDNQIKPHFNIVNTGTTSVNMSELKIRYYFTREAGGSMVYNCDWAMKGCGNMSGAFVAATGTNTDTYLEISFAAGAGSIAAGQSSGEIQIRLNKSDWTNFNESNDYSFDPTKLNFADWNRVVLLRNGTVVWGTTP